MSASRSNWSRPLPSPLVISEAVTQHTLATCGRCSIGICRPPIGRGPHWLAVGRDLEAAAHGHDPGEAAMAIRLALLIEGVARR